MCAYQFTVGVWPRRLRRQLEREESSLNSIEPFIEDHADRLVSTDLEPDRYFVDPLELCRSEPHGNLLHALPCDRRATSGAMYPLAHGQEIAQRQTFINHDFVITNRLHCVIENAIFKSSATETTMKATVTINKPKSTIEGWTGYVINPRTGKKIRLVAYCGGGVVSFNTKEALIEEAKRVIRGLAK